MTLDNGNLDTSQFLIPGTPYINFEPIMELDWFTAVILSGRKMGKTFGFWSWFVKHAFPSWDQILKGESLKIFGSIVGKTNEISTSDMIAPYTKYLESIKPDDFEVDFDFMVHNRICYLLCKREDNKGKQYIWKQIRIGCYGALSQTNTLRRLGNQNITEVLIEECNPERNDHPFVGTDIANLSSAITSMVRVPEGVRIIALGNQQLYPSIPLRYLNFDEDNLGLHGGQLSLMLNRPPMDNTGNFLSRVNSTSEYDSLAKRKIHDVVTLKYEPEHYVKMFNRKTDLFFTSSLGITIAGWFTQHHNEKCLFVTTNIEGLSADAYNSSKDAQCYENSPIVEEQSEFGEQLNYLRQMYYKGNVVIGKGDRETYYALNQLGCILEDKVKLVQTLM